MAGTKKGFGSVKRFGARYGRRVKQKLAMIEKDSKRPQMCPYCQWKRARKLAAGIFYCTKCKAKFTGGAYIASKRPKMELLQTKESA